VVTNSLLEHLLSELNKSEALVYDLLDSSKIGHYRNDPDSVLIMIGPSLYWDKLDNEGLIKQAKVLKVFTSIYEIIEFIFSDKASDIKSKIEEIKTSIMSFVDQKNWISSWGSSIIYSRSKENYSNQFCRFA